MTIGEQLRRLRLERRWTQGDVASRLGVTDTAIGRWELGRAPVPRDRLAQLGPLYGLSTDHLDALLALWDEEALGRLRRGRKRQAVAA